MQVPSKLPFPVNKRTGIIQTEITPPPPMQKTVHSVAQVAFFFFVSFGLIHISTAFLVVQGVGGPLTQLLFETLDLPFLMSALVYGTAQLSLKIESISGHIEWPLVICSLGSLVLFLAALSINFLFLDV